MVSKISKLYCSSLLRGMVAYAISWQTSSLVEQTIKGRNWNSYEWKEAFRFGFFGGCILAPTLHCWVNFLKILYPENNVKNGLAKSALEQISYAPFALCMFFICMNLLEGNDLAHGIAELKLKFFKTQLAGIIYWAAIKTLLYTFVSPQKVLPYNSLFAFIWSLYLESRKHNNTN